MPNETHAVGFRYVKMPEVLATHLPENAPLVASCETCQFGNLKRPFRVVECRRFPPSPAGWPKMELIGWCGEWSVTFVPATANKEDTGA